MMLVLPKVLWAAAWETPSNRQLTSLRTEIERCVRRQWSRSMGGRSRLLVWDTHIGPQICPYHYAATRAIGMEQRRLKREIAGKSPIEIVGKGKPMTNVCDWLGWTHRGGSRYETRDGILDLNRDGNATINAILRRAWVDWMGITESRVLRSPDQLQKLVGSEPLTAAHRAWNKATRKVEGICNERVGWMYAPHGKWTGYEHTKCACGADTPDRAHWAWECKWCNGGRPINERDKPYEEGERRLCVPLVERPIRGWTPKDCEPIPGLRAAVQSDAFIHRRAIVATDGAVSYTHLTLPTKWTV